MNILKSGIAFILLLFINLTSLKTNAVPFRVGINKSVLSTKFYGTWEVKTKVIASDCRYVEPGLETNSKLSFDLVQGQLRPRWISKGWDTSKDRKLSLSLENETLYWERDNMTKAHGSEWLARSFDFFQFRGDHIKTSSLIDQYQNGKYVGSYETVSILYKI